ncbi:hypothetical protein N7490_007180 [Penicillium lividum]|nr:hypothetical protein N7490_007180 [Penicillium lividum]
MDPTFIESRGRSRSRSRRDREVHELREVRNQIVAQYPLLEIGSSRRGIPLLICEGALILDLTPNPLEKSMKFVNIVQSQKLKGLQPVISGTPVNELQSLNGHLYVQGAGFPQIVDPPYRMKRCHLLPYLDSPHEDYSRLKEQELGKKGGRQRVCHPQ